MNIALLSLGCRLNEAELQSWAHDFQQRGHHISDNSLEADLVVMNTCAVTQEAVKKSRQLIRKTQRNNPRAKLIVTGCYASLADNLENDIEGIDLIVDNRNKDRLVEIAAQELQFPTMPSTATAPGEFSLFSPNRCRAFVKVQDGCRYRCTFCIVTVARGQERSRSIEEIINQVNALSESGVNEVVLTGVHIGGYGGDLGENLHSLLQQILNNTSIPRIRLGSVEPWDLPEEFFGLFDNPRFMPHLHLPLQSGCDSVLRRMARRCKTEDYRRLIDRARAVVENFQVTTDIIVGFPGETADEWQTSHDFIASIGFSHTHIFSYSPRAGTKAAAMPDQVAHDIKKQRSQQLHKLASNMKRQALETALEKPCAVLWESRSQQNADGSYEYFGYTPNFLRVVKTVDDSVDRRNRISLETPCKLSDSGDKLFCRTQKQG